MISNGAEARNVLSLSFQSSGGFGELAAPDEGGSYPQGPLCPKRSDHSDLGCNRTSSDLLGDGRGLAKELW